MQRAPSLQRSGCRPTDPPWVVIRAQERERRREQRQLRGQRGAGTHLIRDDPLSAEGHEELVEGPDDRGEAQMPSHTMYATASRSTPRARRRTPTARSTAPKARGTSNSAKGTGDMCPETAPMTTTKA
jgi:hypothetical protein